MSECVVKMEMPNDCRSCPIAFTSKFDVPGWHRMEEKPKEDGWYMLGFLSRWRNGNWWIPEFPDYWMMPAGTPKEK